MKLFIGLFCALISTFAFAEDDEEFVDESMPAVVERMTCEQIQEKITELSAEEEPDDDIIAEITKLKGDYRRGCTKSAGGRRNAAASRVSVEVASVETDDYDEEEIIEEEITEEEIIEDEEEKTKKKTAKKQKKKNKAKLKEEQVESEEVQPEEDSAELLKEKLEQELSNLNSGLCVDGSKPNKFGCCGDEIFKDMGNMVFACCPKEGGDCFPPIQ